MSITILIADDHEIIRDGLRSLIEKQDGMEVVDEAGNGRDAVELALRTSPDVVIMDVGMPDLNGIEATRRMVAKIPGVKVIALSMHSDRRTVAQMLHAGAAGFVLKDSAFAELVDAIRSVVAKHRYLSPRILGTVLEDYVRRTPSPDSFVSSVLTERQREVLQLIAEGLSTAEIARRLHVSVKTIETHRKNIMDKLKVHSIAELTKYAVREGLTFLDT